jgi:hypothetical protein
MPVTGSSLLAGQASATLTSPSSSSVGDLDSTIKCSGCHVLLRLPAVDSTLSEDGARISGTTEMTSIGEVLLMEATLEAHEAMQQEPIPSNPIGVVRDSPMGGLCARCLAIGPSTLPQSSDSFSLHPLPLTTQTTLQTSSLETPIPQHRETSMPSQPVLISPQSYHPHLQTGSSLPSFPPLSFFPPGMIESIPSSSTDSRFTRILTPHMAEGEQPLVEIVRETAEPTAIDTLNESKGTDPLEGTAFSFDKVDLLPESHSHAFTNSPATESVNSTCNQPVLNETPPNPLLDIARLRRSSHGRGTLYPGSVFRGKQTSGRSSYEVEVRILDVDFASSTLSGYLSISHLTDAHPKLTTFFSGEIVGEKYGFLTGTRYYAQATEQDDLRHWSRFDRFRQVRSELRRPGLTMPDRERGPEGTMRERGYVFMRWKERFLVPDHKVKDISGASFAGFYYLQLELEAHDTSAQTSVGSFTGSRRETVYLPSRPNTTRRMSSSAGTRLPSSTPPLPPSSPPQPRGTIQEEGVSILPCPPPMTSPDRPSMLRRASSRRAERERDVRPGYPVLKVS